MMEHYQNLLEKYELFGKEETQISINTLDTVSLVLVLYVLYKIINYIV